jgi:hypothetical protein
MKVRIYRLEPILSHLRTPLHKYDDEFLGVPFRLPLMPAWPDGQMSDSGLVHCPQNFIPSGFSQPHLEQSIPKNPK